MKRITTILLTVLILLSMMPAMASADAIEDVRIMIRHWNLVWNQKDFDKFIAFYKPTFQEEGYTFSEWKAKIDGLFNKPGDIAFTLGDIWVLVEGDRATASFVQEYHDPSMPPKGLKSMELERINGQWKIVSEKWEALEETPPLAPERMEAAASKPKKTLEPIVTPTPAPVAQPKAEAQPKVDTKTTLRPNRNSTYPYTIQVGAYPTKAQAFTVVNDLNLKGHNAFFNLAHIAGKGDWYRVFVGYYASETEAYAKADYLKRGHTKQANIVKRPYALQIGRFTNTDQDFISKKGFLKAKGYIGYIVADKYEPNKFRYLMGAYKTQAEAAQRVGELARDGIKTIVDLR